MRPGSSLAISALVHLGLLAGALAWLGGRGGGEDAQAAVEPVEVEIVAAAAAEASPELVTVELVDAPTPPAHVAVAATAPPVLRAAAGEDAVAEPTRAHAIAIQPTPRAEVAAATTTTTTTATDGGSGAAVPDHLRDPSDVLARIAGEGDKRPLPDAVASGKLTHLGGDRARIDDAVTTVTVDADGTPHFHDKPNLQVHFFPGLSGLGDLRDFSEEFKKWEKDPYYIVKEVGRSQDLPEHVLAVPGAADSYGIMPPSDGSEEKTGGTVSLIGGKFDVTDWAMRTLGHSDPYAARKAALLAKTFEERAARRAEYKADQLDRSAEIVTKNLEALWRATTDPAQRREALFEMWDECAEGDDATGEAGARARSLVVAWIRAKLPMGSAGAYGEREIAALSARKTSKQAFAPYE